MVRDGRQRDRFVAHDGWVEGRAIGEPDTLIDVATELGLDEGEVRSTLEGEAYAVSGAQKVGVYERALTQAWGEAHPN